MEPINKLLRIGLLAVALTVAVNMTYAQDMPQSWNDGASKQAIAAYVEKVTKERLPDYVSPDERIVSFDGDGTLWAEEPMLPGR